MNNNNVEPHNLNEVLDRIRNLKKEIKIKEKQLKKLNNIVQKRFQQKLSDIFTIDQSDEAIKLLIKSTNDIITFFNKEYRIVFFHAPQNYLFKYEDFYGKKISQIFDEETVENIKKQISIVFATKNPFITENKIIWRGNTYWFLEQYTPILNAKNEIMFVGRISHDITELKKAQFQLEREKERFKLLFNVGSDLKFVHGFNKNFEPTNFIEFNDVAINLLGYSRKELSNMKPQDLIENYESKKDNAKQILTQLFEKRSLVFEAYLKTKFGKKIPFELNAQIFQNEDGDLFCLTIGRDITFRKQYESKLKESEFRYRTIFHHSPLGLFEEDLTEAILFVLKKNQNLLNQNLQSIGNKIVDYFTANEKNFFEFFNKVNIIDSNQSSFQILGVKKPLEIRKIILKSHISNFSDGKTVNLKIIKQIFKILFTLKPFETEIKFKNKNGLIKEIIMKITPITPQKSFIDSSKNSKNIKIPKNIPTRLLFTLFDITEKRIFEREIQKKQKLESLGLLAGGIAHDFNNFLTAILGSLSLIKLSLDSSNDVYQDVLNAENAALQAKNLTKQLLTFARGGTPVKKIISLKNILYNSANFCLRGSSIKSIINIDENLYKINADEGQIIQVFNNLIINAMQSMPNGGIVFIRASNIDLEEINLNTNHTQQFNEENIELIQNLLALSNNQDITPTSKKFVKIEIEDQGIGIPEENIDKIFDPFFTTKEYGSGLGLTVAYSIIKNHDGFIKIDSEVNKGTKVTIFLPATEKTITEVIKEEASTYKGSGTVLILEDDHSVAKILQKMLKKLGFQAITKEEGDSLIKLYKELKDSNKLVKFLILDLTIPNGKGGKETLEELLKIDPNIKAFASSGYADDFSIEKFIKIGFIDFLPKPYTLEELKSKIMKHKL
ncbi:MAG: PAS domain-containing hybrid sensor histidine kinase/response regulator [Promethearchaeota archaeon]